MNRHDLSHNGSSSDGPARILVVDDERAIRVMTARWLTHEGFVVDIAADANEALSLLGAYQYDLMVSDIMMPGKSGIELLQEARNLSSDMAVLMVTALDYHDTAIQALELGAYGYIIKPVERNELVISSISALERRRLSLLARATQESLELQVQMRTEEIALRLVSASDYRDEETGAHIRRIGLYSEILAGKIGWDDVRRREIRVAAPMHDVGKIGIPDQVLRKPGKLTPEEFDIIKEHTLIGEKILQGTGAHMLIMAKEIAAAHHEKWDGSGYPRFLAGHDIPEGARIVAIVDVYDALSNDRVYRPAMPEDKVLAILREGRGSHFDPDILDTFLDNLPAFRQVLAANRDGEKGDFFQLSGTPAPVQEKPVKIFQDTGSLQQKFDFRNAIFNAISSPFYVIDAASHEIVFANHAAGAGLNVLGKTCYSVTHQRSTPCDGSEHLCPLNIVRETGREAIVDHVHLDGDNQERVFEVHGYPLFDRAGRLTHMIEFASDITVRKQAVHNLLKQNQELIKANKAFQKKT